MIPDMKNLKPSFIFFILFIFLIPKAYSYKTEEIRVGRTREERARLAQEGENRSLCSSEDFLNSKITVEEFMATCHNGIVSGAGCRVNIEKACINGQEVSVNGMNVFDFKLFGFHPSYSHAVTERDFSQDKFHQMYNEFTLPNGQESQLCTEIPGFSGGSSISVQSLPPGNYEIHTVPNILKPDRNTTGWTLHYDIIASNINGNQTFQTTVYLGDTETPGTQFTSEGRHDPYRAVGKNPADAEDQLFLGNGVRCKPAETLLPSKNNPESLLLQSTVEGDPSTYGPDLINLMKKAQDFLLKSNPGLNASELRSDFASVFKTDLGSDSGVTLDSDTSAPRPNKKGKKHHH
jgi:hypothetical protein